MRTIKVDYLARVEGEGALTLRLEGDKVTEVALRIFEPPRFFEAFLQGRDRAEVPDITARICGICPVAYQMSACHAIERAAGVAVEGPLRALRRLLYCGEWIESHGLHAFMLHAPDFLGKPDAVAMAKEHPELVKAGLRIKKAGNAIVRAVGGREVHPINVKAGGFYRSPTRKELSALLPELAATLDLAEESLAAMARFDFPELERDVELVALVHPDEYPFNEGRIVSTGGLDLDVSDYDAHFVEEHVERSNALHSRIVGRGAYLCGPLARYNLNFDRLTERAKRAAEAAGIPLPCRNPFKSLLVRMVEIIFSLEEAQRIIEAWRPPPVPAIELPVVAGVGWSATEAPRGLLYHRYAVGEDGLIQEAKIVPPTSQNQLAIEDDLAALGPQLAALSLEDATWRAEQAIRNYDPCISCATHFLTLKIERT
ncbi:MAG: Ni/Fe hydrogenase subunit alpha [Planctomycetota bacterium]|jgi:coenzyme F420-reducing hydrogenase alpha subunit